MERRVRRLLSKRRATIIRVQSIAGFPILRPRARARPRAATGLNVTSERFSRKRSTVEHRAAHSFSIKTASTYGTLSRRHTAHLVVSSLSEGPCPIDCTVSEFVPLPGATCSVTCGGGVISVGRSILNKASNGGRSCPPLSAQLPCNEHECPPDGTCPANFRQCFSGDCIPIEQVCNGNNDCSDGVDEICGKRIFQEKNKGPLHCFLCRMC